MSQSRCFALLGDSNIRNIATKTNCRANPVLQSAQIIPCGNLQLLTPSLEKVRAETTVCVLSCLTNFLTSAEGPSTISHRIEPVLPLFTITALHIRIDSSWCRRPCTESLLSGTEKGCPRSWLSSPRSSHAKGRTI